MQSALGQILDFIVDVLIEASSNTEHVKEGPESDFATPFGVLLWNDETHSFQEVISQVVEATHVSAASARLLAEQVDAIVCCV